MCVCVRENIQTAEERVAYVVRKRGTDGLEKDDWKMKEKMTKMRDRRRKHRSEGKERGDGDDDDKRWKE